MEKVEEIKKILATIDSPTDIELVMKECIYFLGRTITRRSFQLIADNKDMLNILIKKHEQKDHQPSRN